MDLRYSRRGQLLYRSERRSILWDGAIWVFELLGTSLCRLLPHSLQYTRLRIVYTKSLPHCITRGYLQPISYGVRLFHPICLTRFDLSRSIEQRHFTLLVPSQRSIQSMLSTIFFAIEAYIMFKSGMTLAAEATSPPTSNGSPSGPTATATSSLTGSPVTTHTSDAGLIGGIVGGVAFLFIVLVCGLLLWRRRKKSSAPIAALPTTQVYTSPRTSIC
jgi:hypothetical protein